MKVSDYVAAALDSYGVQHVFELSGGMITHLLDSMHRLGRPCLISVHHEQAAAFAADAVGRHTGVPGVAMATSGPGAVNLLTGVGSCYFDSSPAVFITGQVNTSERKDGRDIRQLGFQETDIVAMAAPVTKAAWEVRDPEEVPAALARAFALALQPRRGPVLLDIPMDVQRAEIPDRKPIPLGAGSDGAEPRASDIAMALETLARASRPLVLAGGGIRSAGAAAALRAFVERLRIPVVHSLMAVDVLPFDHPLRAGMIGTYGNRWANLAVAESDVLLVLGSRLDIRQTGSDVAAFKAGRTILQVDCDPAEINNRVTGCRPLIADVALFLARAIEAPGGGGGFDRSEWLFRIEDLERRYPDTSELAGRIEGTNPNAFMHAVARVGREAVAYVVDVGQNQMWAAQSLELSGGQRFITSGGMGSMGFALPAAVGCCLVADRKPVVVIAGDGGFQCNIQELQTVARLGLPLKMIVLNNRCHGMVRQFQEAYFEGRYQSTLWGYSAPRFADVARAYGIASAIVQKDGEAEAGLELLWKEPGQPFLLEVEIDTYTDVQPKVMFGQSIASGETALQ